MNEFLGIKNVIDAQAILGKDGCADGFRVISIEKRKLRNGMIKEVQKEQTVWVREYVPENNVSHKNVSHKKEFKMTDSCKEFLNKKLGKK